MPDNPRFNIDDTVRNEGNAAHWLIEQVHKHHHSADELVDRKAFNGVFITEEMIEHTAPILDAIRGKGEVECDTSYGDGQRYQINGRADWRDLEGATLYIFDFKYGWSIVEPENNWTLISHALGFMFANPTVQIDTIVLRIYQPRPHHPAGKIREHVYTRAALLMKWEELYNALVNPNNLLNTSPECRNCLKMATCPAAAKAAMNAIDVSETAFVSNLDEKTLGFMLDQIDRALSMLEQNKKAYSELALHRLKTGKIIPGYGVEKELTNRQWKDGITPETVQMLVGMDISKKTLITPNQAAKKGVSEAAIESLCERREKGIKLAKIDANKAAKKMFGDLK